MADFGTAKIANMLQSKLAAPGQAPSAHESVASSQGSSTSAWSAMTSDVGTILWMAPEVMEFGRVYGQSADVYSYAIVCWELVEQQPPWVDDDGQPMSGTQVRQAVLAGQRPPLRPSPLRDLMHACWAHDPDHRPSFDAILARACFAALQ